MATLHCISGGKRVNTREMLDNAASENYRMATEIARLKHELDSLRNALVECLTALSTQNRKTLSAKTAQTLENLRPASKKLKTKAAAQS